LCLLDYLSILFSFAKIFVTVSLFLLVFPVWRWVALRHFKNVLTSSGVPKTEAESLTHEYPLSLQRLIRLLFSVSSDSFEVSAVMSSRV
jgi:hypothetical protein